MVHDPLTLVRVGPQQLIGGRPAGMLGRGVPLQVPGADEPLAAAVDRAAPLQPWVAWVVEAEQVFGWAWRTSRHEMQISTVNRPSTSLKGPVKVPQNEQCGTTPHPLLERSFERIHSPATLGV